VTFIYVKIIEILSPINVNFTDFHINKIYVHLSGMMPPSDQPSAGITAPLIQDANHCSRLRKTRRSTPSTSVRFR
jgi:hypothetical protein